MGKWWSNEEIEFLEDNFVYKIIPAIAKSLNRKISALKAKAVKL